MNRHRNHEEPSGDLGQALRKHRARSKLARAARQRANKRVELSYKIARDQREREAGQ